MSSPPSCSPVSYTYYHDDGSSSSPSPGSDGSGNSSCSPVTTPRGSRIVPPPPTSPSGGLGKSRSFKRLVSRSPKSEIATWIKSLHKALHPFSEVTFAEATERLSKQSLTQEDGFFIRVYTAWERAKKKDSELEKIHTFTTDPKPNWQKEATESEPLSVKQIVQVVTQAIVELTTDVPPQLTWHVQQSLETRKSNPPEEPAPNPDIALLIETPGTIIDEARILFSQNGGQRSQSLLALVKAYHTQIHRSGSAGHKLLFFSLDDSWQEGLPTQQRLEILSRVAEEFEANKQLAHFLV